MALEEEVLTGMALYWWVVFVLWATRLGVMPAPPAGSIHRSAWKGYSRNFALTAFSEINCTFAFKRLV
jgi:hypothetical protein